MGGIGKDGAGETDVKYTEVLNYKRLVTDGVGWGEGEGRIRDLNDLGKLVDDGWPFGTGNREITFREAQHKFHLDMYLINQWKFEVETSKNALDLQLWGSKTDLS